jgi:transposase-like protein
VAPAATQRSSHHLNNGLERDHQHLEGRVRLMRHLKPLARAHTFRRGQAGGKQSGGLERPEANGG